MKQKFFSVWIPVVSIVVLAVVGTSLNIKNHQLMEWNQKLILQNDSILSVNLELAKYSERLQCQLDSASVVGR